MVKIKDLYIFGAGGLGREIAWQIQTFGTINQTFNLVGFVDDTPALQNTTVNSLPVVGDINYLINCQKDVAVVICLGDPKLRKMIYDKLNINPNITFPPIICGGAKVSNTVDISDGVVICTNSVITVNITIKSFVLVSIGCIIGHDCTINDFATLYPNSTLSGNVTIGAFTEIGTGASVIPKQNVGCNCVVGAGGVVINNIPDNYTAVGVPAFPKKENPPILNN